MEVKAGVEFADRLAQLRAASCEHLPTPELAVLARCTARLRRSGIEQRALQLGETAPDFMTPAGRLYELLEDGPCILNFFRGFWCAFCRTELEAFANIREHLDAVSCRYIALSPEPVAADVQPGYLAIHDVDNGIARQFGLVYALNDDEQTLFRSWGLNLDEVHGSAHWELPLPATYLVAEDRTVAYQYVDVDFRARCCPDDLLQELGRLRAL